MNTRFLRRAAWVLVACCPLARATPVEPAPDYAELARLLAGEHPEYRAMQSEVEAAAAAERVAEAFPDPMIQVELMDLDADDRMVERSTKYTWEQLFPLWGKRGLRREAAEQGRALAAARAELTLAELRAMLRMAYAELYAAHRATAINDEVDALLGDMAQSARTRYANGLAAQQDLIRVRVEQSMLATERALLRGEIERASVQVNSLVGAPVDAVLGPPAALPPVEGIEPAWERLRVALEQTPALAAADADVRRSRAARELASRERYPDLAVGVSPVEMDGRLDSWQLMFRVEVPLFGARTAAEAESVAMLAGAEHRRESALRGVHGTAAQALAGYRSARERQQLFETRLLGESELNLRAALAGYQGGQVDFDTVIEAERQVRDMRLQALTAAVEQQRAVAQFEQVTGVQP